MLWVSSFIQPLLADLNTMKIVGMVGPDLFQDVPVCRLTASRAHLAV